MTKVHAADATLRTALKEQSGTVTASKAVAGLLATYQPSIYVIPRQRRIVNVE